MEIYLNAKTVIFSTLAMIALYIGYTVISAFFAMINNYIFVIGG